MKKILIAIDGSKNALESVEYVENLFRGDGNIEVTLLHIYSSIPLIFLEEKHDSQIIKQFKAWIQNKEAVAKSYIADAVKILHEGGFSDSHIYHKCLRQVVGVARDIIREADAGEYDAIVVGKKGMHWFDDFFLGSITNKLLELSVDHPVWAVEGKPMQRKVLISLDDVKECLDIVKYAAKMLSGIKDIELILYHCCAPLYECDKGDDKILWVKIEDVYEKHEKIKMEQLFREARKILIDAGCDANMIHSQFYVDRYITDKRISKNILGTATDGQYCTVIMGRKGATHAREFNLGAVCRRTVNQSENCTIWIV